MDRSWEIREDEDRLVVMRSQRSRSPSGPTISSPEELEEFIGDLRVAATHVWPPEAFLP
jgi:hypothetical protein